MGASEHHTDWDIVRANLLDASFELPEGDDLRRFRDLREAGELARAAEALSEYGKHAQPAVSAEFWRHLSVVAVQMGNIEASRTLTQRYLDLMAPTMSAYEEEKSRFMDLIGHAGNVDNNWFDKVVEYWRIDDGSRLHTFEASDLGRQLVRWNIAGRRDISRAVLTEVEYALGGADFTPTTSRDYTLYLLDGMLPEILEQERLFPEYVPTLEPGLRDLMGDETKLLWVPFLTHARENGWSA